ncbi:hypothetical protein BS50DRAFT_589516 [Corynespora cassiicola Philippines]|uniref:Uncharacterized protein n=1 Tax=Corynespora cassiicola Philippines TaxID=1448308 RepID=A0A2T2NI51_CORCC|nr:hypothetical protein BS50DRAFT_589516 [Corynespora cassiicola Philippines]
MDDFFEVLSDWTAWLIQVFFLSFFFFLALKAALYIIPDTRPKLPIASTHPSKPSKPLAAPTLAPTRTPTAPNESIEKQPRKPWVPGYPWLGLRPLGSILGLLLMSTTHWHLRFLYWLYDTGNTWWVDCGHSPHRPYPQWVLQTQTHINAQQGKKYDEWVRRKDEVRRWRDYFAAEEDRYQFGLSAMELAAVDERREERLRERFGGGGGSVAYPELPEELVKGVRW